MYLKFWGVRGSIPAPGQATSKYGGNSSCVEVVAGNRAPMILDCGTGARDLGPDLLARGQRHIGILFSHLHLDHLFGFPFFAPLYAPSCKLEVVVPAINDLEAKERIGGYLNGVFHPVRLRDVPSDVSFRAVTGGDSRDILGYQVQTVKLNHPGGAVGYRLDADGTSVVYMSDTAPFAPVGEGIAAGGAPVGHEQDVLDFLQGADVVVYDTMYTYDDYLQMMNRGHSYPEYAYAMCAAAGVRRLVLFHHLPEATDDQLDALAEHWATVDGPVSVSLAVEGSQLQIQ